MSILNKKFIRVPHLTFFDALKEGGRNPFVDWVMVIIVSAGITLIMIGSSVYLYKRVVVGDIQGELTEDAKIIKVFNKKELYSIIDRFDRKAVIEAQYKKSNDTQTTDPIL